ncbi:gamma-glutamyltranspeptidase [Auraticoccus sp. F435]|uniref:Gamma-glutamyltranspeptidase n=1 Tax=Auraticoccus cholistanensis TaxID=2656650 RepID=A0A6A9UV67_9ACTN|nr:gamma-glutamyltranspeptidase [Auraticoccus cholistanensis]
MSAAGSPAAVAPVRPGVAAAHPTTAGAGANVLRHGGHAVDAAVAMVLVSCAAETLFTGLSGGGFAVVHDAGTGETTCVDFFVAVPGLGERRAGRGVPIEVYLGGHPVPYEIGPATVAVPGVPAGVRHLWQRWGRTDWASLVEPALLASYGTPFPLTHAQLLPSITEAMCAGEGAKVFCRPDGTLLQAGDPLVHPEHWRAFELLKDSPEAFYSGPYADAVLAAVADGGGLSATDLAAYRVRESPAAEVALDLPDGRVRALARGDDMDDVLATLASAARTSHGDPVTDPAAACALVEALRAHPRLSDTTNVCAVDADGNACVATTSLGLGSSVYVPGYGVHLNSMLGEGELVRGEPVPGQRVNSMMSPMVVLDDAGRLRLVAGAAGGSRIRPALVQTVLRMLRGTPPQEAIDRPRLAALPGGHVRLEPGFSPEVLEALVAAGSTVFETERQLPFFGGVSAISPLGAGADPRRSGEWVLVED